MIGTNGNKRTKRKGFSMLELVIIIMIMTVLAGVMSPMFFQSKESANLAKADSEIGAIASALKMYYAQNGQFPAAETAWKNLKSAGLLPSDPVDPWGDRDECGVLYRSRL